MRPFFQRSSSLILPAIVAVAFSAAMPSLAAQPKTHHHRTRHNPPVAAKKRPSVAKPVSAQPNPGLLGPVDPTPTIPVPPAARVNLPPDPASPNTLADTAENELFRFDQDVKKCDHLLWLIKPLPKRINEAYSVMTMLGDWKTQSLSQGDTAKARLWGGMEQKVAFGLSKDLIQLSYYMREVVPLSRKIHASPLFNADYFIGDNVVPFAMLKTQLWSDNEPAGVTETDVQYIESSKTGLGRPQSELAVEM